MRIKLSFQKANGLPENGVIALHHQKIIGSFLYELVQELLMINNDYCYSSLKGTSKVANGQIKYLSPKISLVICAPDENFINTIIQRVFERQMISLENLVLIPKSYQVISEPSFNTIGKYVCISPFIPCEGFIDGETPIDPTTHEFSDKLFDCLISRMEKAGYSDGQLNEFAEFEITPDENYFRKIHKDPQKYARVYSNINNEAMYGYLFPFSIHAHPEVHKFIWERGLGFSTKEGYGMVDTVPESSPLSDHIIP